MSFYHDSGDCGECAQCTYIPEDNLCASCRERRVSGPGEECAQCQASVPCSYCGQPVDQEQAADFIDLGLDKADWLCDECDEAFSLLIDAGYDDLVDLLRDEAKDGLL